MNIPFMKNLEQSIILANFVQNILKCFSDEFLTNETKSVLNYYQNDVFSQH